MRWAGQLFSDEAACKEFKSKNLLDKYPVILYTE